MAQTTNDQFVALMRLFDHADGHDNGGALVIQRFLLSLYNGRRFQFDLTDLRLLDQGNFEACLQVLRMDHMPAMEVHARIAQLRCQPDSWGNLVFERWAYDQRLKGRCKKDELEYLANRVKATAQARRERQGAAA